AYLTNETIFDLTALPKHLIVIGGGPIGCELAQGFAMLGSKVTIVEAKNLLPKDDEDCVEIVRQTLKGMSIEILEGVQVKGITRRHDSTIEIQVASSEDAEIIVGSHLLVATGRKVNVEKLNLEKASVHYTSKGVVVNARL